MASRLTLAVVGAFSISLLLVGGGGAAVCDPHCAPSQSNTNRGGDARGLERANSRAGVHGQEGRDKAAQNPGNYKPTGGSGGDTGGSTGGDTGGSTGGDTGGGGTPCTGC
jgi:hypothetical protein